MSSGFTEQLTRDLVERRLANAKPIARLGPSPAEVVFPVSEFWRSFGLTPEDIRDEVAAGRLVLSGMGNGEPGISLGAYMMWTMDPNVPDALRIKDRAAKKGNRVG